MIPHSHSSPSPYSIRRTRGRGGGERREEGPADAPLDPSMLKGRATKKKRQEEGVIVGHYSPLLRKKRKGPGRKGGEKERKRKDIPESL